MTDNKNYQIELWFPRSIYISKNPCDYLLGDLEKYSIEYAKKYGTTRNPKLYVDSAHVTCSVEIKKEYPFKELAKHIKENAVNYFKELGFSLSEEDIYIINMWFNISNEGDFNFPHCHPGSTLSGIYYVKTVKSNTIEFYDSDYATGQLIPPDNYTNISFEQVEYPCIPGCMMMWRSNLIHCNPRQMEEGDKIAISFNLCIKRRYDE